jgi:hypothetical protein
MGILDDISIKAESSYKLTERKKKDLRGKYSKLRKLGVSSGVARIGSKLSETQFKALLSELTATIPDLPTKNKLSRKKDDIDYQGVIDSWNSFARKHGLVETTLDEKRKRAIKSRLTDKRYDHTKLFELIEGVDWMLGKSNLDWAVNFDYIFCKKGKWEALFSGIHSRAAKIGSISSSSRDILKNMGVLNG